MNSTARITHEDKWWAVDVDVDGNAEAHTAAATLDEAKEKAAELVSEVTHHTATVDEIDFIVRDDTPEAS